MSAPQPVGDSPVSGDPLVVQLDWLLETFAAAVSDGSAVPDQVRIDRIQRLERLKASTVALQGAESVRFTQSQVEEQLAADVHPERIGRGIADQIGLACRISPAAGSRRLGVARALWFDLPRTYAQLTAGELSEQVAELVVTETRHLDATTRRRVDGQIVGAGITGMGVRAAAACARRHAYAADPCGYVERGRTERKHRRVGCRPAPDTMAVLTGYLPVEQGVACYAALRRHTDTVKAGGDVRTRDQIMADTLVERLTGQTHATDVGVELQLLMPLASLIDPNIHTAAELAGAGPLPAGLARQLIASSRGRKWWRRLFTHPSGQLVGGDPQKRTFDGWLAQLITLRDQTCRGPYCDAPIRELDHIQRWSEGGQTVFSNGRGTCTRGNLVREMPGWQVQLLETGLDGAPHTTQTTTPTGHRYLSRAPDPP